MQIENQKADVRRTDFTNIGIGKPFWWDDTLCLRIHGVTTDKGHQRNYLNLETGYTGYLDPSHQYMVSRVTAKVVYSLEV